MDHPCAAAHNAGNAADMEVADVVRDDAMPVGLVLPACVVIRVLRAVLDDDPAHVLHLPDIERSENDSAWREINGVSGAALMFSWWTPAALYRIFESFGFGASVSGRLAKRKSISAPARWSPERVMESFAGCASVEADGAAFEFGAYVQAPGLDLDTLRPVIVRGRGNHDLRFFPSERSSKSSSWLRHVRKRRAVHRW